MYRYSQETMNALSLELEAYRQTSARVGKIIDRIPDRKVNTIGISRLVTRVVNDVPLGILSDGRAVSLHLEEVRDDDLKWVNGGEASQTRRRGRISRVAESLCPKDTRYADGGVLYWLEGMVNVPRHNASSSDDQFTVGKFNLPFPRAISHSWGVEDVLTGLDNTLVRSPRLGVARYLEADPSEARAYIDGVLSLAEAAVGIPNPADSVLNPEVALGEQFLSARAPGLVAVSYR